MAQDLNLEFYIVKVKQANMLPCSTRLKDQMMP